MLYRDGFDGVMLRKISQKAIYNAAEFMMNRLHNSHYSK